MFSLITQRRQKNRILLSVMLSLNCLRIVCSSSAVLQINRQMTNRLTVFKTLRCLAHCMCTSYLSKDVRALRKERGLVYYTYHINSPMSYCTGHVRLNCWNCKQRLDDKPAFFCMSCKVVQPPEEEISYFKIMDW